MGSGDEFDDYGFPDWEGYEEWSMEVEKTWEDVGMLIYEDDYVEDDFDYEGEAENEDDEECDLCQGTGIGQHGDPNTSRCSQCGGNGYYLRADIRQEREYARADYLYDCWADDNLFR